MNQFFRIYKNKLIAIIIAVSLFFVVRSYVSTNTLQVFIDAETISEVTSFAQNFKTSIKGPLLITKIDNKYFVNPTKIEVQLPEAFLVKGQNPKLSSFYARKGKSEDEWQIAFWEENSQSAFANWTARNISRWLIKNYFFSTSYKEVGFKCQGTSCTLNRENEENQLNIENNISILKQIVDVPVSGIVGSKTTSLFKLIVDKNINVTLPLISFDGLRWTSLENESMPDSVRVEIEKQQVSGLDSAQVLDALSDASVRPETLKNLSLLIKYNEQALHEVEQLINARKIPLRNLFRVFDAIDRSGNDQAQNLLIKYFENYPYPVKSNLELLQPKRSILSILAFSKYPGVSKDSFFFLNNHFALKEIDSNPLAFNFYLMAGHYLRANKINNELAQKFVAKIDEQLANNNIAGAEKLLKIVGNLGDEKLLGNSLKHFISNQNLVIMALRFMKNPVVERFYQLNLEKNVALTSDILEALQFRKEEGIEISKMFQLNMLEILNKRADEQSKIFAGWLSALTTH
jgi:hypothetical protein